MEREFNQYEFENYLEDEFFNGNEKSVIGNLINKRIASDKEFKVQYELWFEESNYRSWKEFYQFLINEKGLAWDIMNPNNED